MLRIIGVLLTLAAAAIIPRVRGRTRLRPDSLGWMSSEWLAEHRASSRRS